jgi:two-component sensor histidine kinase
LLAVVQSVVQLTRAENGEQLKAGITGRIQSLARAHSLLAEARWEGVELTGLAREEVAPYGEERDGRITLHGPRLVLKPAAAQSIALVLHELATNAAKYGALSTHSGRLELSWCIETNGGLLLVWQERGGVACRATPPTRSGFGSRLIKASIERQLRGSVAYEWAEAGLTVTMTVAPEYVALGERDDAA